MSQRLAIAWLLLILVGLLLGLLIAVVAIGVSRHLRRQRPSSKGTTSASRRSDEDEECDEPSSFSRSHAPPDDDPDT